MTDGYIIEEGVPVPPRKSSVAGRRYSMTRATMVALKPNQSFFANISRPTFFQNRASIIAEYPNRQYVMRYEDDGIRVWRIK